MIFYTAGCLSKNESRHGVNAPGDPPGLKLASPKIIYRDYFRLGLRQPIYPSSHRATFSRTLRILRAACVISSSPNPAKPSKRACRGGLAV
jgi:hypothetical protein